MKQKNSTLEGGPDLLRDYKPSDVPSFEALAAGGQERWGPTRDRLGAVWRMVPPCGPTPGTPTATPTPAAAATTATRPRTPPR